MRTWEFAYTQRRAENRCSALVRRLLPSAAHLTSKLHRCIHDAPFQHHLSDLPSAHAFGDTLSGSSPRKPASKLVGNHSSPRIWENTLQRTLASLRLSSRRWFPRPYRSAHLIMHAYLEYIVVTTVMTGASDAIAFS